MITRGLRHPHFNERRGGAGACQVHGHVDRRHHEPNQKYNGEQSPAETREKFAEFFVADGVITSGSALSAKRRSEVTGMVTQFFDSIGDIKHEIVSVWEKDGTIIVQPTVTCLDGKIDPASASTNTKSQATKSIWT